MDAVPYYPQFMACDPCRTPAWRWQRAQWLVSHARYFSRRRDDAWTGQAVHYLRGLRQRRGGLPSKRLIAAYPFIHSTSTLNDRDGKAALMVQARILAGQSCDAICRTTGVALPVIEAYERLFFEVRA